MKLLRQEQFTFKAFDGCAYGLRPAPDVFVHSRFAKPWRVAFSARSNTFCERQRARHPCKGR
eukprot:5833438-Lingulodinium_polyedra.AAC.1